MYGNEMVFVEDAMASLSAEMHRFPVKTVFSLMGKVTGTDAMVADLGDTPAS